MDFLGISEKIELSDEEIDNIRKHHFFKDLELSEKDVLRNHAYLQKIIYDNEKCSSNPVEICPLDNLHLFVTKEKGRIYFYNDYCPKKAEEIKENKYKELIAYNYYQKSKDSNNVIEDSFIQDIMQNRRKSGKAKAINYFLSLMKNNTTKGIYLYGEPGVGKTYLLLAMSNSAAKYFKKTTAIVYFPDLLDKSSKMFHNDSKAQVEELYDKLRNVDILFLDDIGSEFAYEWFYSNCLLNILNYRYSMEKPTYFSSNFTPEEYGKKIESRLKKSDAKIISSRIMRRINEIIDNKVCLITKGEAND